MDALGVIEGPEVQIGLTDGNSSCLIQSGSDPGSKYVVMPMRL
jgi:DNA polymerase III sliding clamp (beta) subunit (PCNA family)